MSDVASSPVLGLGDGTTTKPDVQAEPVEHTIQESPSAYPSHVQQESEETEPPEEESWKKRLWCALQQQDCCTRLKTR